MVKPILWVGQSRTVEEVTRDFVKDKFGIESYFADNVRRAVSAINSREQRGVCIADLWIPCGKYHLEERMLDSNYDGGLFVIKYASERNLPVLVYGADIAKDVRDKAAELGAKVFPPGAECIDAWLNEIKKFFGERNLRKERRARLN
jgi:hypothetical protein